MDRFLTSWLGLVISSLNPFDFNAGASATNQDAVKEDLINIMPNNEELQDSIASKLPTTGAVMDELLGKSNQGSLVCN